MIKLPITHSLLSGEPHQNSSTVQSYKLCGCLCVKTYPSVGITSSVSFHFHVLIQVQLL